MGSTSVSQNQRPRKRTFSRIAMASASGVGSAWSFAAAIAAILVWGVLGPHYHYSDAWQLVMNSFTDIFTFLIVFLIQNTQKRDSKAINLKLDEIIRAVHGAEDELIDIEKCSDEELENLEGRYERIRREVRMRRERGEAA